MLSTENRSDSATRVRSATIVDRRSGPGYRLVLRLETAGGTPVIETLPASFDTIAAAAQHATGPLGLDPADVRVNARSAP